MKNLFSAIILASLILTSTAVSADSFSEKYPELTKNGVLIKEKDYKAQGLKPYFPDSEIFFFEKMNVFYEMKSLPNNTIMIRNVDTNIANFGYSLLHDFSNQSWQVVCVKDRITDKSSCGINNNAITIIHDNNKNMISSVNDVGKLNLNKEQYVRVDNNNAISSLGVFENTKYDEILEQMRNGVDVKTRYSDIFGKEHNNDANLLGFKYAFEYMTKLELDLSN